MEDKNLFPDRYLRGIPSKDKLDDSGFPSVSLFLFSDERSSEKNPDYNEESINWYDNEDSLDLILKQRKEKKGDTVIQFQFGVALMNRLDLLKVIDLSDVGYDLLKYERHEIEGNPFHGNLLLKKGTPKAKMNRIAAAICLGCVRVIQNDNI